MSVPAPPAPRPAPPRSVLMRLGRCRLGVAAVLGGLVTAALLLGTEEGEPEGEPAPPAEMGWAAMCSAGYCTESMEPVQGGTFLMGAQANHEDAPGYDPDAGDDEGPPHRVTVSNFYLDFSPVTVREFADCVREGGCRREDVATGGYMNYGLRDRKDHPMNGVSWRGARDYCAWLDARLPTEAEWEWAARSDDGRRWSWGDEAPSCDRDPMGALFEACPREGTMMVANYTALGPFGHIALSGAVWEWTADWYAEHWYARSPAKDPVGPSEGTDKVHRGGGFNSEYPAELRAAFRAALPPDSKLDDIGFRCARDADHRLKGASHLESRPARRVEER